MAPLTHDMMCTAGCGHTWHVLVCEKDGCICHHSLVLGYKPG